MATDTTKVLGYGGSAVMDGEQVLITSGAYTSSYNVSWLQMISTPPLSTQSAGRVLHADGYNQYAGSLSFDVTADTMSMFGISRMLKRWYTFDVGINDGNVAYEMKDCKATSVSLTGSVGGLVSASVSFVAKETFQTGSVTRDFIREEDVVGYWWSGAKSGLKAKSWSFTMSQDVQPVFGNVASTEPLYLKAGLVEYNLEVESYTPLVPADTSNVVYIATSSFTLTGRTSEEGFQYNGLTDLGTYRYVFGTGATLTYASDEQVIT